MRVHTDKSGSEERAQRLARDDALGDLVGLTLPADAAGGEEGEVLPEEAQMADEMINEED